MTRPYRQLAAAADHRADQRADRGADRRRARAALLLIAAVVVGVSVWATSAIETAFEATTTTTITGPEPSAGSVEPGDRWTVVDVIDGDTLDVRSTDGVVERVRVVGIDTPERGQCGHREASEALTELVMHEEVTLVVGSRDDSDRYGRLLRYVDMGSIDAGLALVERGLAVARYDSRDGYGEHPREDRYVATDAVTASLACGGP